MANQLFWSRVNRAFNSDGTPADGAKAFFFQNKTTTQLTVYSDADLTTPYAQPILADAFGVFPVIYTASADAFTVAMTDKDDVMLGGYPQDDIPPSPDVTAAASIAFSPTEAIPQTNVQDAIEAAGALSTDQTAIQQRSLTAWVTGGTGNAFTITPSPALVGYGAWQAFLLRFNRANTGAATLNVNALGARSLRKYSPAGAVVSLAANDVAQGMSALAVFDGTQFIIHLGGPLESTKIGLNDPAAARFTTVNVPSGAAITPVIGPASDTDTGIAFPTGGDKITLVTVGTERVRVDDTDVTTNLRLRLPTGSNVAPVLSPIGDANTGIAFPTGGNKTTVVSGGSEITRWNETAIIVGGNLTAIDPAAAQYGASITVGGELVVSRSNAAPMSVKRGTDGTLVLFYSGTTAQGSISVSGTTITYGSFCAVHWSQGDIPEDTPPGTILDALDEMCVWDGEADERLPKVGLSAEGSSAVYGVFFRWDDDGSDDMHVASAGALYVRMAPSETPARGDLIESAGAGLGRVQADGIIRSSTVAKITAAVPITTYGDGSRLFPATLHCG